jgi:ELP3 family radical SAM enzyme/protein acetyltransferase
MADIEDSITRPTSQDTQISSFVEDLIYESSHMTEKEHIEQLFSKLKKKHRLSVSKRDVRREIGLAERLPLRFHELSPTFKRWLIKTANRTDSGVLVVTITLSPHKFSCKYNCYYCPQETDLQGVPTQPRSYLSTEPAMLRALTTRNDMNSYDFDVRNQFLNRIQAYKYNGIIADTKASKKIEVILSGGTWESYPETYRNQVIQELYWSANTIEVDPRPINILEKEITDNETAEYRIIGLTLETRPDNITKANILNYLRYGVTRIQLGEQTDNDEILQKINRRCYKADTIRAHSLLKQAGFKVVAHLMPDLPGSSPEADIEMFSHYLTDPALAFDDVKIYPTAVCKSPDPERTVSSKIAEWYEEGSYKPYAEENIEDLYRVLKYYKTRVPPWVRIQRVVRDIPGKSIEAGYHKISNLRQLLHAKMEKEGLKCHCIYCMEADKHMGTPILVMRTYEASGGLEIHLSVEAHKMNFYQSLQYYWDMLCNCVKWLSWAYDMPIVWQGRLDTYVGLYGFLRLRIDPQPGGDFVPEIYNCALIREVHVYGQSLGVGSSSASESPQHRGYGRQLMATAEMLALAYGFRKTAVIAGVGTREYYKNKCDYYLDRHYMKKWLPINVFRREIQFVMQILPLLLLVCVKMLAFP